MDSLKSLVNILKDKKILIYGTGKWASKVIGELDKSAIVGVLDRDKTEGEFQGVPILSWENIPEGAVDIIVIASQPKFYKEIYSRIYGKCLKLGIDIYSVDGQNLRTLYDKPAIDIEKSLYYSKTKEQLLNKIAEYDAISFDVFDTLVMRKVLEPVDIFDLIDRRLQEKGIEIDDFCKKRHNAELKLLQVFHNATIDDIYELLQAELHLDENFANMAKELEMQCELENLVPRMTMVEIFKEALRLEKKVCLISDMYYPADILGDMLKNAGVDGYDKLFVSCDYNTSKSENLFAEYKKYIGDVKALHIGDNMNADVLAPRRYGIDSFEIWSSYKMLENSSMSTILFNVDSKSDKIFLGYFIADVLNDPFALHDYAGTVCINTVEQFCYFLVPLVIAYMDNLYDLLDNGDFDTVLFSARDCYFFKRVYDAGLFRFSRKIVPCVYFEVSRMLLLKTKISNLVEYVSLFHLNKSLDKLIQKSFGDTIISRHEEKSKIDMSALKQKAKETKENLDLYIKKNNIKISEKCVFCDLFSSGSAHYSLNQNFNINMQGFYLAEVKNLVSIRKLTVSSVYDNYSNYKLGCFLEKIFTAPVPSVVDMCDGKPVYGKENRSVEEIKALSIVHSSLLAILIRFKDYMYKNYFISNDFAISLVEKCSNVVIDSISVKNVIGNNLSDDLGAADNPEMIPLYFA